MGEDRIKPFKISRRPVARNMSRCGMVTSVRPLMPDYPYIPVLLLMEFQFRSKQAWKKAHDDIAQLPAPIFNFSDVDRDYFVLVLVIPS